MKITAEFYNAKQARPVRSCDVVVMTVNGGTFLICNVHYDAKNGLFNAHEHCSEFAFCPAAYDTFLWAYADEVEAAAKAEV